ncbi:MAG: AAA family ATPase [Candidatus Poseidoniales archaeon]|jgi:replication factor C large subunit|tara:strand:+ start:183 stop:1718 length:1536 start_codon:yes stop_codon:yes gene_type:complete
MGEVSDWTERHRPVSERQLEGNEVQRRKIRKWLDDWQSGTPSKKALLLVGPPGVGKTSVARAVAADMGWNVIELNASDARNAAAIRKAATQGSTHRSLFHDPNVKNQRTLILLDEVDHLSGGLRAVNQEKLEKAMMGDEIGGKEITFSGDSGGKAELLRLLDATMQPVILACNEEMGLWGKGSTWRSTRDRFSKHLQKINFERASDEALRRIAKRVLREEKIEFDDSAVEELVKANPGDLRALVRDLQVVCVDKEVKLTTDAVRMQIAAGQRDISIEVFPGLDTLYRSRTAEEASTISRSIDKSPDDLMNWVHWNNASLFTDPKGIVRGARSLAQANKMFYGRFLNTAHRSTYWCSNLSALSASIANPTSLSGRIFPSYPNFLRRGSSYTRPTIIDRLASTCGANKSTVREEMMPILSVLLSAEEKVGDASDFTISLSLGLTAEEHASLAGLPLSRRSTKDLIADYNESQIKLLEKRDDIQPLSQIEQQPIEQVEEDKLVEEKDPGQTKLF